VFLQGRDANEFIASDLHGVAFTDPTDPSTLWRDPSAPVCWDDVELAIDTDRRSLTLSAHGVTREVLDLGRYGCVAVPDDGAGVDLPVAPRSARRRASTVDRQPWPQGNAPARDRVGATVDLDEIDAAIGDVIRDGKGRAIVVAHQGRLIAEQYARPYTRDDRHLGWSATKSLVGALIGRLVQLGELDPAQPAPVAEWRGGDPRAAITIDHLLRMSSGLHCARGLTPWADGDQHCRVYTGLRDVCAFSTGLPLIAQPARAVPTRTVTS
jgi:hypothetical protein